MSDVQAVSPMSEMDVENAPAKNLLEISSDVLIVDDMVTIQMMLGRYIKQLGHSVTLAGNGREALEKLRTQRFDLVLLDVIMPEMDGYAVLEQIKRDAALRDVPVVMISGVDDLASVVRCIEAGAEDYLTKPFEPTLLRARVKTCLEKKHLWDERDSRYKQLQRSECLRDSLTHMIVHDLRTPLTSLLTGLQTAEAAGDLNEIQQECLTMGVSGGQTLLGMINDLLDVSKLEAGQLKLDYSLVSVPALFERSLRQVKGLIQDKLIIVEQQTAPDLPQLQADEDKLRRVLINLLGNAIKFTADRGKITVKVDYATEENSLRFAVQDTGEGIPEEAFHRIFEKFGQVENSKSARKMSTGLGLTFCKMAVEAHSGRIWVESQLGRGSTFFFTIPVNARH